LRKIVLSSIFLLISCNIFAQNDTIQLKEIEVSSNRITLPFSKTSRTISLLSSDDIHYSSVTNLADLLQLVPGVDIRRRGTDGMQSDLYIRGGNFDQSLVLIDGVKMDDPQTGHHSMNAILDLSSIERIEIIKGPAARIFGQNAFTGAINIITKNVISSSLIASLNLGSYNNFKKTVRLSKSFKNGNFFASVGHQKSDGYRFNTDFNNFSSFLKSRLGKVDLLASFVDRKFGANGFYASPLYKDQYEETQTSLIAVSTIFENESIVLKPRVYWRRNQDMYLFLRNDPAFYRNLHISNKMGAETNVVLNSKFGKTGIGVDFSRVFLVSNNLGDHKRTTITGFIEHRFELMEGDLDLTPGVALSYYSDFDTTAFPGLDLGYQLSDAFRLYANVGYTYRVPTFTDLYYVGPTTMGNSDLKPESAISEEIGMKFRKNAFTFNLAVFQRDSDNLIDWTKDTEEAKWETRNFSEVRTRGFETSTNFKLKTGSILSNVALSYSFIDDQIKDTEVTYTRYSLNSLKHQVSGVLGIDISRKLHQNISYRYVERTDGSSHSLWDASFVLNLNRYLELTFSAQNIFNAEYTETNGVPMPKGHVMSGLTYKIY